MNPSKPFLTKKKYAKSEPVSHVSLCFRIVLYGSCKRILTLFRLILLSIASLEFVFASFLLRFGSFRIFFVKRKRDTLVSVYRLYGHNETAEYLSEYDHIQNCLSPLFRGLESII
jgi:hypothetical protein